MHKVNIIDQTMLHKLMTGQIQVRNLNINPHSLKH